MYVCNICVYAYYMCIYIYVCVYVCNLYSSVEEIQLGINYQNSLSNNTSLIFIKSPGFV